MEAQKCQRCNNRTTNPNGLCYLHQAAQAASASTGTPAPKPTSGSKATQKDRSESSGASTAATELAHWPMRKEDLDDRFDQGNAEWASETDSADDWTVEPRDEELLSELDKLDDGMDKESRQAEYEEIMEEWGRGYVLKDGRTITYNGSDRGPR